MATDSATTAPTETGAHPLAPLTASEVERAAQIVKDEKGLPASYRFVSISLHEPPKEQVLGWDGGVPPERRAFVVLYDRAGKSTYEAVVSLTDGAVPEWRERTGVQPALLLEEFLAAEEAVRADPRWQEAMRKRGVTDLSLAVIDPWPCAYLGPEDDAGRRLARPLTFLRAKAGEHHYARPIEGLLALVDLDTMEVLEIEDHGVVPVPGQPGNYIPELMFEDGNRPQFERLRADVKPLAITQPEGPSFTVDGHLVEWQKWRLHVGWTLREGLVLFDVRYEDRGELRPILYRASLSEMAVPYGSPQPTHVRKCAFDESEYGLGLLVNALEPGCDCLGEIHYFDGLINDQDGNALPLPNAICMHEEDVGIAWKHYDFRAQTVEVRRMRRLVLSSIVNVGNYEYGFFWYLYQDGSIEFEVKLTGVLSTGAFPAGEKPRYGAAVAPGLYGPNHQHFFCLRLDMDVDGPANTVVEVNSEASPPGQENPYGNAWIAKPTPLRREAEAQRSVDLASARYWRITNPSRLNELGEPVAYRLEPGANARLYHQEDSPILQRARFATNHLWVTPYRPDERYAAGDYPNQNPGPDGLARWVEADRDIENTDVVVWYVFGSNHVARPEEWPVVPVERIGFHLKPDGFFDGNPALDLTRPHPACHTGDNGHHVEAQG
jgi:primary-amine oxidase